LIAEKETCEDLIWTVQALKKCLVFHALIDVLHDSRLASSSLSIDPKDAGISAEPLEKAWRTSVPEPMSTCSIEIQGIDIIFVFGQPDPVKSVSVLLYYFSKTWISLKAL
jgi:hypothetical protein